MIARRLAAVAAALLMIAGAIVVRDRIDGDSSNGDGPANAGLLVCATELADLCRDVADALSGGELVVVAQPAAVTIDSLSTSSAEPALWLTFDGFPTMLNSARDIAGLEAISFTSNTLASSPIATVVRADRRAEVTDACGDPADLGCVGALTTLRPAMSSVDSGIGLIAITAALEARAGEALDLEDLGVLSFARGLKNASESWNLAAEATAVGAMQTRTTMAVGIGAEAELVAAQRDNFDVLYADPMVRARVVLMKPDGFEVPEGLSAALEAALDAAGWDTSASADAVDPSAGDMLRVRSFWAGL